MSATYVPYSTEKLQYADALFARRKSFHPHPVIITDIRGTSIPSIWVSIMQTGVIIRAPRVSDEQVEVVSLGQGVVLAAAAAPSILF